MINFERGKPIKETLTIGIRAKLEKAGGEILMKYAYEFLNDNVIKQIEYELEQAVGIPVEVIHGTEDGNTTFTIKIKKDEF